MKNQSIFIQFRERDLAAANLKAQLAQAQLQTLKSQIHPHFLFNTLNTVSALVHEDPDAACSASSGLTFAPPARG